YLVGLPLAPVAPVLGVDLVALVECRLAVAEAAQLLVLADVHPELDDDHPVLDELELELVDLAVGAPPFRLRREALQALDEYPPVPGAVVYRHQPRPWHVPPEPPQVMVGLLLVRGLRHLDHPEVPGVYSVGEPADGASLAGGVPALEHPHHRAPLLAGGADDPVQPPQPLVPLLLVGRLGELVVEGQGQEAPQPSGAQRDFR